MVRRMMICLSTLMLLAGCTKLDLTGLVAPASAEADHRVKESLEINDRVGVRNINWPSDYYSIYVCGDIHTEVYPHRFAEMVRRQRNDSTAAFGCLLGDIYNSRADLPVAAEVMRHDPQRDAYNTPVFPIVGNHDLFNNMWDDFKIHYGSSTYYFTVTTPNYRDLYIMLDSGGGCHGQRQMKWLHEVLDTRDQYRHCIICSHVNIFRTDQSQTVSGNLPLEETYELMDLMAKHKVELYLQGHDHHRKETLYGGVHYITLDCLKDVADYASYMVVEVADGLAWNFHDNI